MTHELDRPPFPPCAPPLAAPEPDERPRPLDAPRPSFATALPALVAVGDRLLLAYVAAAEGTPGESRRVEVVDPRREDQSVVVVELDGVVAQVLEPPTDAFDGSASTSGLLPTLAPVEQRGSVWLRRRGEPGLRHFVFPFAEATVECLARDLRVTVVAASYARVLRQMRAMAGG